ncbi:MAG: hypothetical protein QY306_07660 [Anaerolineales bacterium]|nr:MAG: hypothetical protein QY306_07660 [Anaerolineales bacterium]
MEIYATLCFLGSTILIGLIFLAASIRIVPKGKRMLVYRLGRYIGEKSPGIAILIPIIDRGVLKDLDSNRTDE